MVLCAESKKLPGRRAQYNRERDEGLDKRRREEQLLLLGYRGSGACAYYSVFSCLAFCLLRRGFVGCEAQDVKERRRELYIHLECGGGFVAFGQ